MRAASLFAFVLFCTCGQAAAAAESYHLIPGAVPLNAGPDGNSIVLDAPQGLIVFDTGRHPQHAQAIIDYAKSHRRRIAAVINSHWHLDHTTGNWDIRQAYPHVHVYASDALRGAVPTFLKDNLAATDKMLADPKTSAAQRAEIARAKAVVDHPERIAPDRVIAKSGSMSIAGRRLDVHLAKFAATEGDVWLYDPRTRVAIVGDLVVGLVPYMDTACPDGWSTALDQIAAIPFQTLIPGHGAAMNRGDFLQWRTAYSNFIACGRSSAPEKECVSGWQRDAAKFIEPDHRDYVAGAASYYIETRLRSSPQEQQRYCKPLSTATWRKPAA